MSFGRQISFLFLIFFMISARIPSAEASGRGRGGRGSGTAVAAPAAAELAKEIAAQIQLTTRINQLADIGIGRINDVQRGGPGRYDGTPSAWDGYAEAITQVCLDLCQTDDVLNDDDYDIPHYILHLKRNLNLLLNTPLM